MENVIRRLSDHFGPAFPLDHRQRSRPGHTNRSVSPPKEDKTHALTVLVVDDQPLEGEMIALVLKQDRPDAVYVGQALAFCRRNPPGLCSTQDSSFTDIKNARNGSV